MIFHDEPGVAEFFLHAHRITAEEPYLDFCLRITGDHLSKAAEDHGGLKWVQAEHRAKPNFLQARTGLMQGAAGMGL